MRGTLRTGRYHTFMRVLLCLLAVLTLAVPRAWAQSMLPDLGDASSSVLSPQMERKIGESIARDIRRDPAYIDDPEVSEYLNTLGSRLVAASPGARQDFEFFAMRDPAINAFALPGGYIGMHTGLITNADTESEVASVLAHEIAHVTQRHIARLFGQQQQMQLPTMIAMAAAILAARSRPDLAVGATAAVQGAAVQSQINYTRDFEREADRVGFQTLAAAGFDVRGMPSFFEKLQRYTRASDDGTAPGYLRTHPLTTERVADAQNRAQNTPYRQHADSLEFHLVRAKLRADASDPREAVLQAASALRERRFVSETAARYGLVSAYLRNKQLAEARSEMALLRAGTVRNAMIDTLGARVLQASGDAAGALKALGEALVRFPYVRAIGYAHTAALLDAGRGTEGLAAVNEQMRVYPRDPRLFALQARALAMLGKRTAQHRAQAEYHALQGNLPAAVEQMQLAQAAGDADFYELSVVDARLKDLRSQLAAEMKTRR